MTNGAFPDKIAAETRDYGFDWTNDLRESGAFIQSSTWAVVPAGLTVGDNSFTNTRTKARLSAGTPGVTYTVTNTVTLSSGETGVARATLYVK